ncbi:hypothetical protein [Sutcliffiella horikoshii]|uniref:hypothetical protein n=1 Tax=Sutcliffiella horikoshii TaxID=79883 RepID=UPI00165348E4|nr:hypothetical protein [Sutcliffiella horikoshii]
MKKYLLFLVGLFFATTGYVLGQNENMKWFTLVFYLLGAVFFVIQAGILIRHQKKIDNN